MIEWLFDPLIMLRAIVQENEKGNIGVVFKTTPVYTSTYNVGRATERIRVYCEIEVLRSYTNNYKNRAMEELSKLCNDEGYDIEEFSLTYDDYDEASPVLRITYTMEPETKKNRVVTCEFRQLDPTDHSYYDIKIDEKIVGKRVESKEHADIIVSWLDQSMDSLESFLKR